MVIDHEERRRRYEATTQEGARQYADVLDRLKVEGLAAEIAQTGGMNAALLVQLETGDTLLISDADDSLSWVRKKRRGWGVGLYDTREEPTVGGGQCGTRPRASCQSMRCWNSSLGALQPTASPESALQPAKPIAQGCGLMHRATCDDIGAKEVDRPRNL